MLVSLKWLRDYVDIELTAEELSHELTMAGLEVDEIKTIRPAFSGVVVASSPALPITRSAINTFNEGG